MHQGYSGAEPVGDAQARSTRGHARYSLGCTVCDQSGRELMLPVGALVAAETEVIFGEALTTAERRARFPAKGSAIAISAVALFGSSSYQWGGVTPWGADCSGMVQSVFGLHGISLPRDARQQAELGAVVETEPVACEPGDLLFFSDRDDGRVTHVALAIGEGRLAHLAIGRGGFAIEGVADIHDSYVAQLVKRLCGIRRLPL